MALPTAGTFLISATSSKYLLSCNTPTLIHFRQSINSTDSFGGALGFTCVASLPYGCCSGLAGRTVPIPYELHCDKYTVLHSSHGQNMLWSFSRLVFHTCGYSVLPDPTLPTPAGCSYQSLPPLNTSSTQIS